MLEPAHRRLHHIGAGFDIGASLATGFVRMGPAPTTTWTSSSGFFAGEGSTDPFGNRILSSLGTELDRAQVQRHEGIHSFFSPSDTVCSALHVPT